MQTTRILALFLALIAALGSPGSAKAATIFADDFESGTLANWTATAVTPSPLTIASGTNRVPAGGVYSALVDNSLDRMHRNIIADNGGSEISGHIIYSYWFYDNAGTATRVFNEIRAYGSGTGLPNGGTTASGSLSQLIALGKYNTVTLPGETYNGTKYQARAGFTTNATIYWFNLDGAGSPNRSVGWHKFTMERDASGSTIRFYVDGILSRTVTDVVNDTFDTLVLGFGAGSTVGDGWIDGVELYSGVPTITSNPQPATVVAGGNVSFGVAEIGGFTYQWTHAGTNIPGATASTLNLSGVHDGNVGDYAVIVSNAAGDTTSSTAALTVTHLPDVVFVSDNGPAGFSGPLAGTVDDAFVTFLQNNGYNVIRFNSDNSAAVLLTPAEIAALNTNELIILGRAVGSAAFAAGQGSQWNTNITRPIIVQSAFLTRTAQLGWFVGSDANNRVPMPLRAVNPSDPENAYLFNLFGTAAMNGDTTAGNFDEAGGQGTSHTFDNPAAGANVLATGFVTNKVIVEFPAGTVVKAGADTLAGYRMFFASGNREPSGGTVPQAGNENLTPTGESIFLRALELALNNGVAPNLGDEPVITTQPASVAACTGLPLTLSAVATGQNPLYYQWYFSDGATFTNALAQGTNSSLTFASLDATNAGFYAAVVTNAVGAATSSVASVTISGVGTVASALTSQTNCPGTPVTFTTTATGSGTLTYTWRRAGTVVQGPDGNNSYTIASVAPADGGVYSVEVAGQCNTVTNSATLTVVATPTISAQPQNQTTPMGNGAVFTVSASTLATQPTTYQWQTNGVDVTGATASTFAISNLSFALNGTQVRVAVANCAGTLLSSAATLTVTPVSGISFDFNTPGQFTNIPGALVFNDWMFTSVGSFITGFPGNQFGAINLESPIGGVGPGEGSGALDFIANQANENTITLLPQLFDFSLPGKTLVASTMFKAKAPVNNNRSTQIGFVTATNFGINDNNPQGFMTVILQSTAQPALTYQLRLQHRRTDGTLTEVTPSATTVNLTAGNWYKVKATFANITDITAGTIAISAELQDMGLEGTTPGAVVLSYAPTNIVNTSLVQQKYMMLAMRGLENTGVDFRDNIYAHSAAGPVTITVPPASQTVQHGRRAIFRAYANGDGPYTYQWNKNGNPIAGAGNWKLITDPVTTADDGAQYTVTVTGPGNSVTSDPATLTVQADPLNVVSVGSVDGCTVGVRFDQAVDPVTAQDPSSYSIGGVAPVSAQLYYSSFGTQGRDGVYVVLTPATVLSGPFSVTVQNVKDVSGNAIVSPNNTGSGTVEGLTGRDVNPAAARLSGINYSFGPDQFEVIGGGEDIFGTADSFRFVYEQRTGDFDVKVRVPAQNVTRNATKAGIEVRESLEPGSPQVLVAPNPINPSRNFIEGTTRPLFNAASVGWGPNVVLNPGYPDVWIRVRRSGNVFLRYSSTNGVNWQFDAQLTQPMKDTVYVGLAVCAAVGGGNTMLAHAAQFEQYGDFGGYPGATIAITGQPAGGNVVAGGSSNLVVVATLTGGPGQGELSYLWQRSNSVSGWVNVPNAGATNNILNTGALYITDSGTRYRAVVSAPGALSVTSSVVALTVTDTAVPTTTAAGIPAGSAGQFTVTFSEPVSAATALNPANYVVTNAAGTVFPVSSVSFFVDARTVVITLADVIAAGNYGVTVTGVQDLNGNTVAPVVRTFSQTLTPPVSGPVVVELLGGNITGGATAQLDAYLAHARFTSHQPDYVAYSNLFAHNLGFADATYNNYGARVFSLFVAPSNGLYKIWLRSDDAARVFMNTNGPDRAGQVLVGENTAANATYTVKQQGISLTNGQAYFLEAVMREGGGGDGVSVAIRAQADAGTPGAGEAVPASQLRFPAAEAFPSTPVIAELYSGVTGNVIADQLNAYNNANFVAGVPAFLFYAPEFAAARDLGNSGLDNYLGRIVSHFVPPSTGLYRFWIRSDDSSQFYMNTNAVNSTDPAGKVLLGQLNAVNANYQPAAQNVHLIAGQSYYMEGLWKEGGGGDGMTVTFRPQADGATPPNTEVIPTSMLRFPADQSRFGNISLAGLTPASPVITAGQTLTLTPRGLKGALPSSLFWLRDGVVVGANITSYTTPRLTVSDNGAVYTLLVSNAFSRAEVSVAVTVNPDTTVPVLVGAAASQYGDGVTLTFSEALDPVTATCLVNYSINGLNIISAVIDATGTRVFLTTSPQTAGATYTVTVNDVRDASLANEVAADSTRNFAGWAPGGCGVLVELFTNLGGTAIGNLTGSDKFLKNAPDETGFIPGFAFGTSPQAGIPVYNFRPAANLENYGARLSGYFVAPSNGFYRFYIRGDDGTQLYMNPDGASPAGRILMARNDGANSGTYDNGTGGSASPVLSLAAGQAYYTEALMKEGGGGDYVTVAWRPIDPVTLTAIGGIPPNTESITQPFLRTIADPAMFQITGTPPATLSVGENDLVDLKITATANPLNILSAICYQWSRYDAGTMTFTNLTGGTNASLTFFAQLPDTGQYRLQATIPGRGDLVYVTDLTVTNDITAPYIVSANSLNGTTVGVCFSEPVDVNTAMEEVNYYFNNDPNFNPVDATIRPEDPRTVLLTMAAPLVGTFTLNVTFIGDRASNPNFGDSMVTASVQNLTPMDIGAPPGAGSSWTCVSNEIDVVAGGADIWGTADQGHFTIGTRTGNFDVWTRVDSLTRAVADNDGITKAGIMIRETLEPGARKLGVLGEPPPSIGGRGNYEAGQRPTLNAATAAWSGGDGVASGTFGIPNGWIRIKRTGNLFTAYRSSNGVDWVQTTTHTMVLSNTVYVGLAATAHIPSPSAATTLAKFRNVHIPNPPTIIMHPAPDNQTVAYGDPASIEIEVSNPDDGGTLTYQWKRNGVNIPGATTETLSISSAGFTDGGVYTVVVSNDGGQVTSQAATLVVAPPTLTADSVTVTNVNSPFTFPAADLLTNDAGGAGFTVTAVSGIAPATYAADFNAGLPAGAAMFGNASAETAGGVGNSGYIRLTPGVANMSGSLILDELTPSRRVSAFRADFKLRIAEGSAEPADGFSFNFAPDLPIGATTPAAAENGGGSGFTFCVDNYRFLPYPVGGNANTSGMKIRYRNVDIAGVRMPAAWNADRWVPVSIIVNGAGNLTVLVDGTNVFGNVVLPWVPSAGRFGLYARTGGQFASHGVDDLSATVFTLETGRPSSLGGDMFGSTYVDGGALHITDAVNGQVGSFIVNELTPGQAVTSFNATFQLQIGSGSADGADGFSFNFANDLPLSAAGAGAAEEGFGTGLSLTVDNYPGTGSLDSPSLKLKYGGTLLGLVLIPKWNSPSFVPVTVNLEADGTIDVTVDGTNVVNNFPTPYTPTAGRFGFYARTGGLNQRHWVDNLSINVTTAGSPGTYTADFNQPPYATVALSGGNVTYTPQGNGCGPDTFYYIVSDPLFSGIAAGEVDVNVVCGPTAPITIVNWLRTPTTFSASFNTEAGITYQVQYKNNIDDLSWTTLEVISGDGTQKTFTDNGPLPPTRFYQVFVP